ncbi:hypothetical protein AALO_G00240980 [Alosa alosa]|uniref:BEN domain-containing protein n=1 Tax=Alosa alosa TaxID=278164 RepID=A0AAV6FUB6_9TELE|nr:hypothetical protein AALO_G00240980 [Alosa alosa]
MIDKLAWAYALNSNSATVFVRHLLTAVFPLEILLVSNLRGTKRSGGDTRLPLDKNKLDAIYSATLERFPGTPLSMEPRSMPRLPSSDLKVKPPHLTVKLLPLEPI